MQLSIIETTGTRERKMSTRRIPETVIELAVNAIINTRELCGNERQAAYDVATENGFAEMQNRDKIYRIANYRANAIWNAYQKAAGVPAKYTF